MAVHLMLIQTAEDEPALEIHTHTHTNRDGGAGLL